MAGNLEEAAIHLQRAVDGNALVEDAYWRLAAIRFGQGRSAEAQALLAGLAKALISEPSVVRNLAAGEAMAGDIKGARKRVRPALRRHPKANGLRACAAELAAYELEMKTESGATPE